MSQEVESNVKTFTAGAAISQYARVYLSSGSLAAATAVIKSIGTMERDSFASGDKVGVRLATAYGTRKMIASAAITAGVPVYGAASGKIAATGTVFEGLALEAASADGDIIEVLTMPTYSVSPIPRVYRGRFSTAQVNAGATVLVAVPGFKYRVHDMSLIAIGGNAATATTIDILATQSASSVKLMAGAVAGLTQNTLLRAGATNGTILAGGVSFVENDTNTAITVGKTGSDLATATHIDVLLTYELVSA